MKRRESVGIIFIFLISLAIYSASQAVAQSTGLQENSDHQDAEELKKYWNDVITRSDSIMLIPASVVSWDKTYMELEKLSYWKSGKEKYLVNITVDNLMALTAEGGNSIAVFGHEKKIIGVFRLINRVNSASSKGWQFTLRGITWKPDTSAPKLPQAKNKALAVYLDIGTSFDRHADLLPKN